MIEGLNKAVAEAVLSPEGRRRLADQGLDPVANSPAEATAKVIEEMDRWNAVVKAADIKAD